MDRGTIPINKNFELEYRYYDKDQNFKYFNRKFEIFVLEKKTLKKNYIMHMDNADPRQMMPRVYKASSGNRKHDSAILRWRSIVEKLFSVINEIVSVKDVSIRIVKRDTISTIG